MIMNRGSVWCVENFRAVLTVYLCFTMHGIIHRGVCLEQSP